MVRSDKEQKKLSILQKQEEAKLFETVMDEIANNKRQKGLWGQAIVKSNGDEKKAESEYIKLRVESLKDKKTITKLNKEIKEEEKRLEKDKTEKVKQLEKEKITQLKKEKIENERLKKLKLLTKQKNKRKKSLERKRQEEEDKIADEIREAKFIIQKKTTKEKIKKMKTLEKEHKHVKIALIFTVIGVILYFVN